MDLLFLSPTEWWELAPGQDLVVLHGKLAALGPGQVLDVEVLIRMPGATASTSPGVLLVYGSQLRTALVTAFDPGRRDVPGIMPHKLDAAS